MAKILTMPYYVGAGNENYFLVYGRETAFQALKIDPNSKKIKEGTVNLFDQGSAFIYEITPTKKKYSTTIERQNDVDAQQVHRRSAVITLATTRTAKQGTKTIIVHNKIQLSFPPRCPIMWITDAFFNLVSDKKLIQPYKGMYTYKVGSGGRFAIAKIPQATLDKQVKDWLSAREAFVKSRRSKTTTVITANVVTAIGGAT